DNIQSWQEDKKSFYRIKGEDIAQWYPNQFVFTADDELQAIVRAKNDATTAEMQVLTDYSSSTNNVWGIHARNREQNFALNVLMDPEIDFVSLLGQAGTGKTLLTLAASLVQTLDMKRYQEIIMTRVTVPVGEDIGFLPGTEEEKMTPWMGALMDNLEVLTTPPDAGEWERQATGDLLQKRIKVRSLNFMRGRTFLNRFVIIDEAQNLTSKQMKTLITRAGPGTKIVCLGNVAQIDTPYLTETTSGLTYVVDKFKNWEHGAHITLQRGERSRLADFASQVL
ncbi:MAG: PhoH family protein, partial [Gammaproteobacteria bacterium]|nr:PhoH family protein [Gammaproteobacteria bacterium]